ncbi:MAG: signal peptidase [Candidatus Saccharibacteria bacterium]|nr:signal peptidase [Candidatus Saccharibacteria bacterium]
MKSLQSFSKPSKLKLTWPLVVRTVHGHSMLPVLPPDTYVWGIRWFPNLRINDVVIFEHNGREKIKRISDIQGDQIYVLGDHPDESTDSRHFGWIPKGCVIARIIHPHVAKDRIEP